MSRTINNFNVIAYNVGSLVSHPKRISFENFLTRNKPDAVFLSETRLVSRHRLYFEKYTIFRTDKDLAKTGTAVLVKSSFQCRKVIIQGLVTFEVTCVVIPLENNEDILLISLYNQCAASRADIRHDLDLLNAFCQNYTQFIIGGDFNARHQLWMDTLSTPQGVAISDWLCDNSHDHSFEIVSQPIPTFPRTPSTLDFFMCSPHLICRIPTLTNFFCTAIVSDSDHLAVKLNLRLRTNFNILATPQQEYINYAKINWRVFQNSLTEKLQNCTPCTSANLTNEDIDFAINSIESSITSTIAEQAQARDLKSKYKDLPEYIQSMYKYRQKLRKILQRIFHRTLSTHGDEYQSVLSQLKCLSTLIDQNTKTYIDSQFRKRLNVIKPGPNTFKQINQIVGKKSPILGQLQHNDVALASDQEKTNAFADFFESNFKPIPPIHLPEFFSNVNNEVSLLVSQNPEPLTTFNEENSSVFTTTDDIFTNPLDLYGSIQCGNSKKSSGPDKVSNFVIKKLPPTAIIILTIILNNCLNNSYFPSKWKIAEIFPIPKKPGANSVSSFRPISLLPNLSKLLEMLILNKLRSLCSSMGIVQHNQFGFKAFHSTFDPLLKLHADTTLALNKKEVTVACLLDIQKAFDTVWIDGLIFKLKSFHLPRHLITIIHSFLTNRKFYVRVGNTKSVFKNISAGVAQGSRLGPDLFNLFTLDQPANTPTTKTLLYADDSITYSASISPEIALRRVKEHILRLWEYYLQWGIKINPTKTELICLRNPSRNGIATRCKLLSLTLPDNTIITPKQSVKYLGVHFFERFKFNQHAKHTLRKANGALALLRPLMKVRGGLQTRTKLLLYKQLIRPILTYCFPIWYTISPTYMKKVQLFERKALRYCTSLYRKPNSVRYYSNEKLYETTKIVPIDKYLHNLSTKMLRKIPSHPSPLINIITGNAAPDDRYLQVLSIMDPAFRMSQEDSFEDFYVAAGRGTQYNRG